MLSTDLSRLIITRLKPQALSNIITCKQYDFKCTFYAPFIGICMFYVRCFMSFYLATHVLAANVSLKISVLNLSYLRSVVSLSELPQNMKHGHPKTVSHL